MAVEMKNLVPSGILVAAVDADTHAHCYVERVGFLVGDRVTIHRENCPVHGCHWCIALFGIIAYVADSLKEALAKANYLDTMVKLDQIHGKFKILPLDDGGSFWKPELDQNAANALTLGDLIAGDETDPDFF